MHKGHGIGWVTLPNGLWNGSLIWSQCDDSIVLHALPTTDTTNMLDGGDMYNHISDHGAGAHVESTSHGHHSSSYGMDGSSSGGLDDIAAEDYDYAVDCGDFIF